ncbi:MAG: hypothetical protein IPI81_04930 [Flavobacteriales bacterium]|nr:hypothetical protein [Flavobacteriales bacterium]MCC6939840.1 hypothetical protein [Flavobacteriales bacterium]
MELPTGLELTPDAFALLQTSHANYQRHARLMLHVDTVNGRVVWCTAHQPEPAVDGRVLTEAEILERATEAFAPLRTAGYTPIISVVEVGKGTPEKPMIKHRSARDILLDGREGFVLRQARPRMLFAMVGGTLELLAMEKAEHASKLDASIKKADHWFRGMHYRR